MFHVDSHDICLQRFFNVWFGFLHVLGIFVVCGRLFHRL